MQDGAGEGARLQAPAGLIDSGGYRRLPFRYSLQQKVRALGFMAVFQRY